MPFTVQHDTGGTLVGLAAQAGHQRGLYDRAALHLQAQDQAFRQNMGERQYSLAVARHLQNAAIARQQLAMERAGLDLRQQRQDFAERQYEEAPEREIELQKQLNDLRLQYQQSQHDQMIDQQLARIRRARQQLMQSTNFSDEQIAAGLQQLDMLEMNTLAGAVVMQPLQGTPTIDQAMSQQMRHVDGGYMTYDPSTGRLQFHRKPPQPQTESQAGFEVDSSDIMRIYKSVVGETVENELGEQVPKYRSQEAIRQEVVRRVRMLEDVYKAIHSGEMSADDSGNGRGSQSFGSSFAEGVEQYLGMGQQPIDKSKWEPINRNDPNSPLFPPPNQWPENAVKFVDWLSDGRVIFEDEHGTYIDIHGNRIGSLYRELAEEQPERATFHGQPVPGAVR